jgi:hypothetical protein
MTSSSGTVRDIGSRRELFVDHYLVESMSGGARLRLHSPQPMNVALKHDAPWEGRWTIYHTLIHDGDLYRLYYRGWPKVPGPAFTCYAESRDGITFSRPELGRHTFEGSTRNNIIIADTGHPGENSVVHNFCPMLDARPGVPRSERFKAMGGGSKVGMFAFVSADGVDWKPMSDQPVVTHPSFAFDSQNVPFWSESEGCYLFYYRTWQNDPVTGKHKIRWISRRTSDDFIHWSDPVEMETGDAPIEQFYVNQTHPYFRAPHLYIATAARFWPGRRVISDAEGQAIDVVPKYVNDCSDAVLMTSRGGNHYDRTFLESFVRPGFGPNNWVSRTNYPVLGVAPTGPAEMSIYINRDYTLTTNCTQRCVMRTDGFASVNASYAGGEMVTPPLRFAGSRLTLNYATSAGGSIRVEIQGAEGQPLPGFTLADAKEIIGDRIDHPVSWAGGEDVGKLAGRAVRLRFVMKDADLYSLRFA